MGGSEPVKVVIINTQYVETDAVSFKSVVQKLTGKDSVVVAAANQWRRFRPGNEAPAGLNRAMVLDRVMSFKEFDNMLLELPPLDELYRLYAE